MPTPAFIFVEGGSGQATGRRTLFGSRIIVRVFDDMGAWMPGELVRFALPVPLTEPSGRFPGNAPDFDVLTDANGRAVSEAVEADDLLGTWLGTVSAVAAPAVKADFYLSNEATPFTPSRITITAGAEQVAAQFTAYAQVVAFLSDEVGGPVPFTNVAMVCPPGHGTFPSGSTTAFVSTDAGGIATFPPFIADGTLGAFDPQIQSAGVPNVTLNFTTIDPAAPYTQVIISGNNQSMATGFQFTHPMVVQVQNALGTPLAGVGVKFSVPFPAPSGATLDWAPPYTGTNPTVFTDANGMATSPRFSANSLEGTYTVYAESPPAYLTFFQQTNGGAPPIPDTNALIFSEA
jgi:hypothetical protein